LLLGGWRTDTLSRNDEGTERNPDADQNHEERHTPN